MANSSPADNQSFVVVVPAAGVGKRMQANCPKQYLEINGQTILSHTLKRLLSHPLIHKVVLALGEGDEYFGASELANNEAITRVIGGKERVDSVLNALRVLDAKEFPWVLVHDAARPCVSHQDIDALIQQCLTQNTGGILASPVKDTMKRGAFMRGDSRPQLNVVKTTVDREQLWHALTPQMYKTQELIQSITQGLSSGDVLTDESSAIELAGLKSLLVLGSHENIKITHPDDLALAEFYLQKQSHR